ncbi:MAG: iron ABC transporter permease [Thermomicrobiales bacterium]
MAGLPVLHSERRTASGSRIRASIARIRLSAVGRTIAAGAGRVPYGLLFVLLVVAFLLNVGIGAVSVAPNQVIVIIGRHIDGHMQVVPGWDALVQAGAWVGTFPPGAWLRDWLDVEVSNRQDAVIWTIRLPRVLMGAVAGAGLAVSGAALQGIFRNPLADPGLIGVSSGAALGAVTAIVLNVTILGIWTLPVFAFGAGVLVTALVYLIARHEGRTEVVTLLLAGVAISAVIGAGVGLLITRATDQQIRTVTFWTMGSLGGTLWNQIGIVTVVTAVGIAVVMRSGQALNLLVLGEREARHLGVHVERTRTILMFTTAAMTGVSVAFTGAIGFVGLVVPHLVRLWLGPDHRRLLPCAALMGASLLLIADLVSRTIVQPLELPIGVVTSLIGGPFFLWLLIKTRRQQGGWA